MYDKNKITTKKKKNKEMMMSRVSPFDCRYVMFFFKTKTSTTTTTTTTSRSYILIYLIADKSAATILKFAFSRRYFMLFVSTRSMTKHSISSNIDTGARPWFITD